MLTVGLLQIERTNIYTRCSILVCVPAKLSKRDEYVFVRAPLFIASVQKTRPAVRASISSE